MKDVVLIKYWLFKRDMERFTYNLFHSRPVVVNKDRRKLLKLAGIGAVGLVIAKIGFGESTNQLINKSTNTLNNLILRKGKKLVFLNRKGESVLEVS